jgi:uncharacterized protein (TIGR03067 family)
MTRRLLLALALGFLVVGTGPLAADDKDEAVRKEQKRFDGEWVLVEAVVDGKRVADELVKKGRITHAGEKTTVQTPHLSKETIQSTAKINPTKMPKEREWVQSVGPNPGKTILAIYEWDGDDRYKIIYDPSGKGRPKEFVSKAGSGHVFHVWQRAKNK